VTSTSNCTDYQARRAGHSRQEAGRRDALRPHAQRHGDRDQPGDHRDSGKPSERRRLREHPRALQPWMGKAKITPQAADEKHLSPRHPLAVKPGINSPNPASGSPEPVGRTFAAGILPFAHSDAAYASPSWLRLAAYAGSRDPGSPKPCLSASMQARGQPRAGLSEVTSAILAETQPRKSRWPGSRPGPPRSHSCQFPVTRRGPREAFRVSRHLPAAHEGSAAQVGSQGTSR